MHFFSFIRGLVIKINSYLLEEVTEFNFECEQTNKFPQHINCMTK